MAYHSSEPSDRALFEQAAGWFDRVSSGALSGDELAQFEQWRGASADHGLAYGEVEAAHTEAKSAANSNEMLALRHEALSRMVMPRLRRRHGLTISGAIAASILAVAGTSTLGEYGTLKTPAARTGVAAALPTASIALAVYQTAVGERLTIALPDGSHAVLNTASRLRVAYSATERRLILEQGQVLFRVAKGQARPFIVQALNRIITAHGTVFDVHIASTKKIKVALLEGSVSVADVSAPTETAMQLQPKEVLVASSDQIQVSRDADIEKRESWRDGLIIFEDESLGDAVAEVNRYVSRPVVVQDERLRQIRVSGAFKTGETAAFVEALRLSFPVRVASQNNDRIVLAYRR